ncbi:1-aminocyclopropane-1-carboxylate deaminase [Pedobacter sp. UYP30]|uniref:1-aminocyclopropane-1-carboxylate deaminase/D-cysteine desulfhydrase n=1 Tax=Pedobacter sp. UYP30 TaxID=1756400 RepID=UPI003390FC84
MFKTLYSPVEKLDIFPFSNLFVKRDDLIDPFISGNKWRKLKYILAKVNRLGKPHLVTFGGAYSNHLVATAAAAAKSNLKCTAFVRGEIVSNEMLFLCRLYGAKLIFVSRDDYKQKEKLFKNYFEHDPEAFFIDEGGASEEAVQGCAEIISELPTTYKYIFCAAGTGTTAAGLLQGITSAKLDTELHIINVLKNGEWLNTEIAKYTDVTKKLVIHQDYHCGGYAKATPQLIDFIKNFVATTGVLLDPVYTAKIFYAIVDLQAKGALKASDKILAIHSGGLLGLMGMKDKF